MNVRKLSLPLYLLVGLNGCASILNGTTESVAVNTTPNSGALCALSNHKGTWDVTTPGSVIVHRGSEALNVKCTADGYIPVDEPVIASTDGDVWGNVLIGGGVGATVDTVNGAAWNYPKTITVTMQAAPIHTVAAN